MTELGEGISRVRSHERNSREEVVLLAQGVHKSFGATPALVGVDVAIHEGEILAVTGESGSGKSTLMLCLAGIIAADQGAIFYRNRDLATMSDGERTELRLSDFGFVFQLGHLVPDMPAITNVALPLMFAGKTRKQAEQEAKTWLSRFGVLDLADRNPGDMSGGQSQRVAIARALAIGPRVVFADEPTGSLDSRNGGLVIELLVGAAREQGSSVILVTHSESVAQVADARVVMRDGMIAQATP
jgi:putative ABC transport system ATP-binding protein